MSENDLIKLLKNYFEKRGDFPVRINNIAVKGRKVHKKGLPDLIIACKQGKTLFIETKGLGFQSDEQKNFQREVESRGHTYILAFTFDDVIKKIQGT